METEPYLVVEQWLANFFLVGKDVGLRPTVED